MISMNDKMREILKETEKENWAKVDNILKEVVDKTKEIKDCIIYDKEGILEEEKI